MRPADLISPRASGRLYAVMSTAVSPLTNSQKERYKICTKTILAALDSQFDGGIALIEVRDYKLYREEFKTFEDYCEEVLKISRRRAYQLIEAAEVKESLPAKASAKIVNESQARALIDVPESQRAAVISEASKNGPLTAQSLEDSASKMCNFLHTEKPIESVKSSNSTPPHLPLDTKSKKAPKIKDEKGYQIPDEIAPLWPRRDELRALMSKVSEIKCQIEKALAENDPIYRGIRNTILVELNGIHYQISRVRAYAVCTDCQGFPELNASPCRLCYGTGFIGKEAYESITAKEKRAMRELKLERARASA